MLDNTDSLIKNTKMTKPYYISPEKQGDPHVIRKELLSEAQTTLSNRLAVTARTLTTLNTLPNPSHSQRTELTEECAYLKSIETPEAALFATRTKDNIDGLYDWLYDIVIEQLLGGTYSRSELDELSDKLELLPEDVTTVLGDSIIDVIEAINTAHHNLDEAQVVTPSTDPEPTPPARSTAPVPSQAYVAKKLQERPERAGHPQLDLPNDADERVLSYLEEGRKHTRHITYILFGVDRVHPESFRQLRQLLYDLCGADKIVYLGQGVYGPTPASSGSIVKAPLDQSAPPDDRLLSLEKRIHKAGISTSPSRKKVSDVNRHTR